MKILYVTTILDTMGFFIPHVKMLLEEGHTVDMACNISKAVNDDLIAEGCLIHNISFRRSPLKEDNYRAYNEIKKLVLDQNYDIIHTHTPIASMIVRLACRKIDNVKIIYTAHGFHFYKGAPLINWLVYYNVERILSKYTDVLITINKEDYNRAQTFKAKKVLYLPGVGIDTKCR